MRWIYTVGILFLFVACSEPQVATTPQQSEPQTEAAALNETQLLNTWLDVQYEEQLGFSPQTRTRLGDKTDYDKLDDYTLAGQLRELEWLRGSVSAMQQDFDYDALNEDGKLSYDMWAYGLEQAESQVPFLSHRYIFGRGGPQSSIPSFLISYQSLESAADVEAYLSRLGEIDRVFSELLARSEQASAAGIRQPRFAYDFALTEIERVTAGVPFNTSDDSPNSPLWVDLQTKIQTLVDDEVLNADLAQTYLSEAQNILSTQVLTAYADVAQWLEEDREFSTEESQGAWALPDGESYYNHRLKLMTTLDLSADEIHNIGLEEVERLRGEMEAIKNLVGYEDTLQEFFAFTREDPQFYYPNTDEGRQEYLDVNNEYLNFINDKLPEYFGLLPKASLIVSRVESFREQDGAAQHYRAGAPDGSRPGVFYSHMSDMSTLAKFQIEDIAYHEGNPGHHMQISIQQELTEVPRFRTQYRTTAYTEGWGLYAEWLAKEMGGFEDPYSDFGRLAGEIWRAVRLVVDTGIHSKQWSEDQAVQYFLDNTPIPEGAVRSEVQRYFAGPGQATAYKIGMMNFQEARANAQSALGDDFDIRAFHDIVLGAGAVPIPMMHARVQRWIQESQQSPQP